ncbi:hypothetical protein [Glycomyces harbinensis]|uniref:Uncharacterized protein n=1 Tax=Glycomyces harbinensis TaxID=58114 RepID=A0A1G7BSY4_9ACTN|nr:hypothetical protein [Glycomyces harbinensis]SDE30241.1 hypothetical protein SAMN05216270_117149 [Glycomyces harbinensis]
MSRPIVAHTPDNPNRESRGGDPLVRGTFADHHSSFTVRASSASAPDSFQVSIAGNPADLVLIVSGLNTGHLHATWGREWRAYAPDWKMWFEDSAFKVFYNGHALDNRPRPGSARQCDG